MMSYYRLRDIEGLRELDETLELHFVELEKLDFTGPRRNLTRFERWMYLFRRSPLWARGGQPLPPEVMGDEEVLMAIEQVKKVNSDAEMRAIIEAQEKWDHDVASRLYDAHQAGLTKGREEGLNLGLEKGREEGLEKGRVSMSRLILQMIEQKFGTVATEVRECVLAGSESSLAEWGAQVLSASSVEEIFKH